MSYRRIQYPSYSIFALYTVDYTMDNRVHWIQECYKQYQKKIVQNKTMLFFSGMYDDLMLLTAQMVMMRPRRV